MLLGKNWHKALQVVDQNEVICYLAEPSGRKIFEVRFLTHSSSSSSEASPHRQQEHDVVTMLAAGARQERQLPDTAQELLRVSSTLLRGGGQVRGTLRELGMSVGRWLWFVCATWAAGVSLVQAPVPPHADSCCCVLQCCSANTNSLQGWPSS